MKSPGGKAENWRKGLQLHHAVKINHTLMTEPSPGPARLRLRGRPCVRSPFQPRGASPLLIWQGNLFPLSQSKPKNPPETFVWAGFHLALL